MDVSVICACGKRLKGADRLVGKRVKCPACGETVVIPIALAMTPGSMARQPEKNAKAAADPVPSAGSVCPHCRADMAPADALCVQCGYHRQRGERLRTVVTEPLMHGCPQDYRVDDNSDRLTFTRGPAIKGGLPWAAGVFAVGLAAMGAVWLVHSLTAGVLLIVFLPLYAIALHRETISVDRRRLLVRHHPFPWPRKTISVSEVEQLYCRRRLHSNRRLDRVHYTHEVCVLTKAGKRIKIIANLPVESHAFFFEERIEHFLGITDRDVEESLRERYGWIVRAVLMLVLAIAMLIVATFF